MVRFQNILIFPTDFNDFIQLWGHLGITLRATFHNNYGRQGPENEKWIPKVAYRRRMAHVMHIMSPCVRPKRVHKQEIHTFPTFFACQRSPEYAKNASQKLSRAWFGLQLQKILENHGRKVKNGPQKRHIDVEWHM